jgi:2-(1,2-epoxy-1,2-dihydrophenyl)acetyl-CoA isomerase
VSYWLPRAVGVHRAKEVLIGSTPLTAAVAHDWGIVSAVWPAAEFDERLTQRVGELASGATRAFASLKRLINRSFERNLTEQIEDEIADQLPLVDTEDHAEGLAAFSERRPPRFTGR